MVRAECRSQGARRAGGALGCGTNLRGLGVATERPASVSPSDHAMPASRFAGSKDPYGVPAPATNGPGPDRRSGGSFTQRTPGGRDGSLQRHIRSRRARRVLVRLPALPGVRRRCPASRHESRCGAMAVRELREMLDPATRPPERRRPMDVRRVRDKGAALVRHARAAGLLRVDAEHSARPRRLTASAPCVRSLLQKVLERNVDALREALDVGRALPVAGDAEVERRRSRTRSRPRRGCARRSARTGTPRASGGRRRRAALAVPARSSRRSARSPARGRSRGRARRRVPAARGRRRRRSRPMRRSRATSSARPGASRTAMQRLDRIVDADREPRVDGRDAIVELAARVVRRASTPGRAS